MKKWLKDVGRPDRRSAPARPPLLPQKSSSGHIPGICRASAGSNTHSLGSGTSIWFSIYSMGEAHKSKEIAEVFVFEGDSYDTVNVGGLRDVIGFDAGGHPLVHFHAGAGGVVRFGEVPFLNNGITAKV